MMTLRPYQSAVFRADPFRYTAVAGERVGGSEEAGAVSVDRSFVYLSGRAVLLNHSLPKNGNPVSDAQGSFRVVSHEDGGSFDARRISTISSLSTLMVGPQIPACAVTRTLNSEIFSHGEKLSAATGSLQGITCESRIVRTRQFCYEA